MKLIISHQLILAHMDVHSNVFIHNFDINESYMILIVSLQCGRFSIIKKRNLLDDINKKS